MYNDSFAGDFLQSVQNAALLFLPADKAEVNRLRQQVKVLEVRSCLSHAHFRSALSSGRLSKSL